jgi:hypothetical protein
MVVGSVGELVRVLLERVADGGRKRRRSGRGAGKSRWAQCYERNFRQMFKSFTKTFFESQDRGTNPGYKVFCLSYRSTPPPA